MRLFSGTSLLPPAGEVRTILGRDQTGTTPYVVESSPVI
jgi:hypothetical protein